MSIVSSNTSANNSQKGIFVPKFWHFYFLAKFSIYTNSMVLISNMTILFTNPSPKLQKSGIFVPKFRHFCFFSEILQIDKFERADLKYDNSVLKFLAQKYPNKEFLVKNTQIRDFWSEI